MELQQVSERQHERSERGVASFERGATMVRSPLGGQRLDNSGICDIYPIEEQHLAA